jgi:hypothetical protein
VSEEQTLSRGYITALAAAAVLIIGTGLLIRDRLIDPVAPQTTPPSEAFALQRLSQESQLRDIAAFMEDRVRAVSPFVVRGGIADASGLRWGAGDSVLSTTTERPVVMMLPLLSDTLRPPVAPATDSLTTDWLLVVGRDPTNRVISAYGISGGRAMAACGSKPIEKLVIGMSVGPEFAGAGIFDLAGRLRGMVVRCGDEHLAAIPTLEVARLLTDTGFVAAASIMTDSTLSKPQPEAPRPVRNR